MSFIEDAIGEGVNFSFPVRCPKCKSWRIISGKEAIKTIRQFIKKEEDLNKNFFIF